MDEIRSIFNIPRASEEVIKFLLDNRVLEIGEDNQLHCVEDQEY